MVKLTLKPDPIKPHFFIVDEFQPISVGLSRSHTSRRSPMWRPPTDVFETAEMVTVRVEIAGMEESEFVIVVDGEQLSIRGMRTDIAERRAYYQMEIRFGEFIVEVPIPSPVDVEKAHAVYQNGFLKVELPKVRATHIDIE